MTRPRDSQRQRLYEAETRAYVKTNGKPDWDELLSWDETLAFVRKVERTRWWKNRSGNRRIPVTVKRGRADSGMAHARRGTWTITLPVWARSEPVILHELAHLLTPIEYAAHGPEYVRNFLAITRRFMPDHAVNLDAEFKAGKVRRR